MDKDVHEKDELPQVADSGELTEESLGDVTGGSIIFDIDWTPK